MIAVTGKSDSAPTSTHAPKVASDRARVLLVSTNRERQPYPVVPNGLACVASALDAAGHEVRFLDLCFERDPIAASKEAARDFRPSVIGVSIRNIDNSDAIALRPYTPEARSVFHALRAAAPEAKMIAGGAAFGVAPEALFRDFDVPDDMRIPKALRPYTSA